MYIEEEKGGELENGVEEVVVGGGVVEKEKEEKSSAGDKALCSSASSGKNAGVEEVVVGGGVVEKEKAEKLSAGYKVLCSSGSSSGKNAGVVEVVVGGGVVEKEKEEKLSTGDKVLCSSGSRSGMNAIVVLDVRRVMVGVGARALFYPTLMYNLVRNKIQVEFRWWDWIDEFVLLGAVPFQSDVKRLKELGVSGVVTLNEPYETLVPTSLYEAHGIRHLVLPTRDYLFAPSLNNICQAVEFIYENASNGQSTYVHCKAGRGRSTTIVLCYLVKYKQMTPNDAYNYVKSIRPRVLLASAQRQAVQDFYHLMVKNTYSSNPLTSMISLNSRFLARRNLLAFDDGAVVVITEADLDGYDSSLNSRVAGSELWADLNLIYRVRVAGGAALARLLYVATLSH